MKKSDNNAAIFGKVLNLYRRKRSMSQEKLAFESDLDRTFISQLERGLKQPTLSTICALAFSLKVQPYELMSFFTYSFDNPTDIKDKSNDISLPFYGTGVSCGKPIGIDSTAQDALNLEELLIKNPPHTFFVRASGDSMSPNIMENDLLMIDTSIKPKNGQIVMAQINNEFTVKRYYGDSQKILLKSENPSHPDISPGDEQEILLCGLVTSIIRLL